MNKPSSRFLEPVLHILALVYIFTVPLLFSPHNDPMPWQKYVQFTIVPAALCLAFYINYLVLVPRCFMQHRHREFYGINALLVVVLVLGISAFMHFAIPALADSLHQQKNYGHRPEMHHHIGGPHPGFHHPHVPKFAQRGRDVIPLFGGAMALRDAINLIFVIGGALALRLSVEWRRHVHHEQQSQLQLTNAALRDLKTQTSPHFLLNTLNNIYSLTAFDTEKAQYAISELSKMLRYQLYESDTEKVLLKNEADFICHYIELMRLRHDNHVSITTHFNIDPEQNIFIAPHILICLVENAFKHGISANRPSSIDIRLDADKDHIHFCCINTNHPLPPSNNKYPGGIGLQQVAFRLQLIYPNQHTWTYGPSDDNGFYSSEITIKTSLT